MIWYLCLIFAVVCMVASIRVLFDRERGKFRAGIAVLLMALAVLVIYVPIFFRKYEFFTALFGDIINMLQVISLDSGYTEFYKEMQEWIRDPLLLRLYMSVLGVMHFAMPAISIFAAYSIFIHYYASLRIWFINQRKRPLYVFSDCNSDTISLAESIRESVKKCDMIFADRTDTEEFKDKIDKLRAVLYNATIQELPIGRRKDKDVYFFCMDGTVKDLNNALILISRYEGQDKELQKHTHIYLLTEQKDVDIMLDSTNKGLIDIRVVNMSERIAYRLLDEHPLYDHIRDGHVTVLLAGLTPVNIALLKAVCWCGQMGAYALPRIYAAGIQSEDIERKLRADVPDLFAGGYDITMLHCKDLLDLYQQVEAKAKDAGYISVAMEDDSHTLDAALELRRLFCRMDETFTNDPPIFTLIRDHEKMEMVSQLKTANNKAERRVSYQLTPFGDRRQVLSYENLVHEPLDDLSKNVHLAYSSIDAKTDQELEVDVESGLEVYNSLEVFKRANRANAMHIRYKLALLGLDYTDREDVPEVDLNDYLTQDKLEVLQRTEHDRWMAFLQSEGWTGASVEQIQTLRKAGLCPGPNEGSNKCDVLKMHPYICDFDELLEKSKILEHNDTTIYDRKLITRIPDILHDKWNISDKKYRIIKK